MTLNDVSAAQIVMFGQLNEALIARADVILQEWYRQHGRYCSVYYTQIESVDADQVTVRYDDHGMESESFPIRFFTGEWNDVMLADFTEYVKVCQQLAERERLAANERYVEQQRATRRKQFEKLKQEFEPEQA